MLDHEGSTVIGVVAITSNAMEADPAPAKIGKLWGRFHREDVPGRVPLPGAPGVPLGVYSNYESDDTGQYELTVGVAVDASAQTPAGLVRASIPAGSYLLFEAEGDMPEVVVDTWNEIWRYFSTPREHRRAYTTDFELHRGPKRVEIYVSVE